MVECLTESSLGSVTQAGDWSDLGGPKKESWVEQVALESLETNPLLWAGDSLWKTPVRNCLPELFTLARMGTIKIAEGIGKDAKIWWEPFSLLGFDHSWLLARPQNRATARTQDKVTHLDSKMARGSAVQIWEMIALWGLFWLFIEESIQLLDSCGLKLYTYGSDTGFAFDRGKVVSKKGARSTGFFFDFIYLVAGYGDGSGYGLGDYGR